MKRLSAVLAITLSSASMAACGSGKGAHVPAQGARTWGYLNDGDNDPANDNDPDNHEGNATDDDSDAPEDNMRPENNRYHDKDDDVAAYGPSANAADKRAIATLVKLYYAAGVAGDGAKACAMMDSVLAQTVPEDYGKPPGPIYLRGNSCPAVMVRLFKRSRAKLEDDFEVTDVRMSGDHAFVLLGSKTMPASGLFVQREHGVWKMDALIGGPLS
jgi:hypothetical protein